MHWGYLFIQSPEPDPRTVKITHVMTALSDSPNPITEILAAKDNQFQSAANYYRVLCQCGLNNIAAIRATKYLPSNYRIEAETTMSLCTTIVKIPAPKVVNFDSWLSISNNLKGSISNIIGENTK